MYGQIGYSVADVVARAVFERAGLGLCRELCVRMTKLSVLLCLCAVAAAVKTNLDQFVAGFAHQMTATSRKLSAPALLPQMPPSRNLQPRLSALREKEA